MRELINLGGDVHHIFPKKYLINNRFTRSQYNQVANYAYLDRPVNESIGMKAPKEYFSKAVNQCETKVSECGSIIDRQTLFDNLATNCVPQTITNMDIDQYSEFLELRRDMMAKKIRKFYESL